MIYVIVMIFDTFYHLIEKYFELFQSFSFDTFGRSLNAFEISCLDPLGYFGMVILHVGRDDILWYFVLYFMRTKK